jgi:hypothetical protein
VVIRSSALSMGTLSIMIMKSGYPAVLAAALILVAGGVDALTHLEITAIDQAVLSKLSAQFGMARWGRPQKGYHSLRNSYRHRPIPHDRRFGVFTEARYSGSPRANGFQSLR